MKETREFYYRVLVRKFQTWEAVVEYLEAIISIGRWKALPIIAQYREAADSGCKAERYWLPYVGDNNQLHFRPIYKKSNEDR